jgi:hypothetical protein
MSSIDFNKFEINVVFRDFEGPETNKLKGCVSLQSNGILLLFEFNNKLLLKY